MRNLVLCSLLILVSTSPTTEVLAVDVTLGTWLEEDNAGVSSVTGSGDSFTAAPAPHGIADDGDNFGERNAARQRVYQLFDAAEKVDFSTAGQKISIEFDVVFNGEPDSNDTDFRFSFVDTSTNQGFYPVSWDIGGRAGTYVRTRFVDQLDGDLSDGADPWGGAFNDAINGSGTIAQSSAAPTISGAGVEQGLVDGNTVHFVAELTRNTGDSFSFTTSATEDSGQVVYPEVTGSYDPVNPTSGDTSVANIAVNQFDGIVFGVFDDVPFLRPGDYDEDGDVDGQDFLDWQRDTGQGSLEDWENDYVAAPSYTVSNLVISVDAFVPVPLTTAVPEPSTVALLAMSSLALMSGGRRA